MKNLFNTTTAVLAALIVIVCAALGALNPVDNWVVKVLCALAFFIGCLRPAWIYWVKVLEKQEIF